MNIELTARSAVFLLIFLPVVAFGQWGSTYRFAAQRQNNTKSLTPGLRQAKVAILTDLSQSTTGGGDSQKKIANGRLGVAFLTERFYGDLTFAVFTNDRSKATGTLTDTAFFYNNLLLAQHQTGGLNEFAGSFGINGIFRKRGATADINGVLDWRNNFGLHCTFRSSNQYWAKDSVYTDVLLNAFSLLLSYQVFNISIESE